MSENTITIVAIEETAYGEKAIVDSPFEAKDYIKYLPFKEYEKEVAEHGSLKGKASDRGDNVKTSTMLEIFNAMEKYGFPDDFAAYPSWNADALSGDGAWMIDRDAVETAKDFWEFVGYNVEVETDL